MRVWTLMLSLISLGVVQLEAQDSTRIRPARAWSGMYSRMEFDNEGRINQLYLRSSRIVPNQGNFEWSAGLLEAGGLGGFGGEVGAAFALGPRPATVLFRGGVSTLLASGLSLYSSMGIGVYGGVSLLVGEVENMSLRIDAARHVYEWNRETRSAWVGSVGFTWRPAPQTPRGRDR